MGAGHSVHSSTNSHSTLGGLSVWALQHLVPAEQLHRQTNVVAVAQHSDAEYRPELVVVGFEGLDDPTNVAGNNPEPLS